MDGDYLEARTHRRRNAGDVAFEQVDECRVGARSHSAGRRSEHDRASSLGAHGVKSARAGPQHDVGVVGRDNGGSTVGNGRRRQAVAATKHPCALKRDKGVQLAAVWLDAVDRAGQVGPGTLSSRDGASVGGDNDMAEASGVTGNRHHCDVGVVTGSDIGRLAGECDCGD